MNTGPNSECRRNKRKRTHHVAHGEKVRVCQMTSQVGRDHVASSLIALLGVCGFFLAAIGRYRRVCSKSLTCRILLWAPEWVVLTFVRWER